MLAMPVRHIPLPPLRGIASAPFVGPDGELIIGAGYHPTVATFLDFRDPLPLVRQSPTALDVRRAMDMLDEPLVDFPFADAAGRALALVVMLLPFVRRHIDGPTPLHLIEKTTPGTGASLLIDVLLSPALGANIAKTSAPASDVEWFYSMHALLRDLPQAVIIDNARELTSKELAKALTDTVLVGRIVRTSSTATIPIHCVWLATGNNVTLHQEIARRVVRCRLDAGMEQPWRDRQFRIPHLRQWLREHRTAADLGVSHDHSIVVHGWMPQRIPVARHV